MHGTTLASGGTVAVLPANWQIKDTGDYNADHKSDILLRNTASGEVDIWHMNGTTIESASAVPTHPADWVIS